MLMQLQVMTIIRPRRKPNRSH